MRIYICKISEQNNLEAMLKVIPDYRQRAYAKCKNFSDQRRSLAASMLLYKAMSDYGISQDSPVIYNEWGKMYFENEPMFYVNLTHGGDYAACVVDSHEVGIDVETLRNCSERVLNKIRNSYDEREIFSILKLPDGVKKDHEFTRFWTKKESQVKLAGRGIADLFDADFLNKNQIYTRTLRIFGECYMSVSSFYPFPQGDLSIEVVK